MKHDVPVNMLQFADGTEYCPRCESITELREFEEMFGDDEEDDDPDE